MGDENNDSGITRKGGDALNNVQTSAKSAIDWLKRSPFARQIVNAVGQEIGRVMGADQASRMDASRAHQLTTNLHQMMANLIAECKEEQRKLRSGGFLGIGGRDLSAHDIDTAVAGFTAITFHFENEMLDYIRRARGMGSAVARQFLPPLGEDSGQMPTPQTMVSAGLGGGRGVMGALTLPPERLRVVAEQLRQIHDYTVKFAADIQEDIAGPHGASPSAHEKALNKAIMLAQRLDYVATQILQLLDPTIDPKSVITGNTGKLQALPGSDGRDGNR